MYDLNIDYKKIIPHVIDVFSFVYGEEHQQTITDKLNNTAYFFYEDMHGIKDYIQYLKTWKKRELKLLFLEKIGYNISKFKTGNYAEKLNENITKIVNMYLGTEKSFEEDAEIYSPVLAFKKNNNIDKDILINNRIVLINFILKENITKDTFEEFIKTTKYQEFEKTITKIISIYENLILEYKEWTKNLKDLEQFVEEEESKRETIYKSYRKEMYKQAFQYLPQEAKKVLQNKPLEEQIRIVFGPSVINNLGDIRAFNEYYMKKINNPNFDVWVKKMIIKNQISWLRNMGLNIPEIDCKTEEDIKKHLEFLEQKEIKQFIPRIEEAEKITKIKEQMCGLAEHKYLETIKNNAIKSENFYGVDDVEKIIKESKIFTLLTRNSYSIPKVFFTINSTNYSSVAYSFIHECGHAIDSKNADSGFDFIDNTEKNPYNQRFKKYERFNETINDIFSNAAYKYLMSKGIYLFQREEITQKNVSDTNTSLIVKKLLYPLLKDYYNEVVNSKINTNPNILINKIGKNNFEELVDIVNYVDYLNQKQLKEKLAKNENDSVVIEYKKQLERLNKVYEQIHNYSNSNKEENKTAGAH